MHLLARTTWGCPPKLERLDTCTTRYLSTSCSADVLALDLFPVLKGYNRWRQLRYSSTRPAGGNLAVSAVEEQERTFKGKGALRLKRTSQSSLEGRGGPVCFQLTACQAGSPWVKGQTGQTVLRAPMLRDLP